MRYFNIGLRKIFIPAFVIFLILFILSRDESAYAGNINGRPSIENAEKLRGRRPKIQIDSESDIELKFMRAIEYASEGMFKQSGFLLNEITLSFDHSEAQEALNLIEEAERGGIDRKYALMLFQGVNYLLKGMFEQAIEAFKAVFSAYPERVDVCYNLATVYSSMGRYSEAIPYLEKLVDINPDDYDAVFDLAAAYYILKEYREAIPYFEYLNDSGMADPYIYSLLGFSSLSAGYVEKSIEYLEKARDIYAGFQDREKQKDIENILIRAYSIQERDFPGR